MRIIVCVKHVPNTLTYDLSSQTINRNEVDSCINPYDLCAIETALRLKEKYGGEVFTLCMGIKAAKDSLIKTIALGADEAFLLSDKKFAGSDTFATSYILAKGINKIGYYDVIICGKQSADGDTGQVGVELAEKLNIPIITNAINIEIQNSKLCCDYISDKKITKIRCNMPCVITIENGYCESRIPTVKNLMRAMNYNIHDWNFYDLDANIQFCGLYGSYTRVKKTYVQNRNIKHGVEILGSIDNKIDAIKEVIDAVLWENYE